MKYYPIHIDVKNKPCLVVGGGKVAQRKIFKLFEAGAAVTVVSKIITPKIKELVERQDINHLNRHYHTDDVKGFFLAFAATNNKEVNHQVISEAKKYKALSNSVNGVDEGDFILPASCNKGDLHIGVTTQGQSPALSATLRKYFMRKIAALTSDEIEAVAIARKKMLDSGKEEDKAKMNALVMAIITKIENESVEPDNL